MSERELLDEDGENEAVRCFLMVYSCNEPVTVNGMRQHMERSGWADTWPAWVNDCNVDRRLHDKHLTKAGAQDWLRHLFGLEAQLAAPAAQEVWCGCGDQIMPDDGARCGTCVAVKTAFPKGERN